ncbi:MAG: hypothetical protein ABSF47_00135 [Minisyncoccia bacterium]
MNNLFMVFGILGLLVISFSIWLRNERKQDLWFILGGALLLGYSVSINDVIFIILQVVFIASAAAELLKLKK